MSAENDARLAARLLGAPTVPEDWPLVGDVVAHLRRLDGSADRYRLQGVVVSVFERDDGARFAVVHYPDGSFAYWQFENVHVVERAP